MSFNTKVLHIYSVRLCVLKPLFHDHLGHIKLTAVSTECFVRFEHHIRDSGAEAWRMDHREGPTDFCYKYSEAL